ncbi:uncharacterized protein LOC62_02G002616 [Vanrija pseudolonga]|uniref:Uncharacterized protein n=1 Tax=Vanrija pseudolonga TaxID=143232 RepID=A0AAF1BIS9_9TREE|nr:hypothetical protein LOC62_02G002616 [Vanrija pseudolonga]
MVQLFLSVPPHVRALRVQKARGGRGSNGIGGHGDGLVGAGLAPLVFAVVVSSWIVAARMARGKAHGVDDTAYSPPAPPGRSTSASLRPKGRKLGRAAPRHGRHARWLAHVVPALVCDAREGAEIWDLGTCDEGDDGVKAGDTYWDLSHDHDHGHDSDPDSDDTDAAPAPPPTPLLSTLDLLADLGYDDDAESSDGCPSGCATPRATPR